MSLRELNNKLTVQLQGDVRIFAEGSGENVKYYAQTGADAGTKKLLGSSMYKCPSKIEIPSQIINGANKPLIVLTFGKDIKISFGSINKPTLMRYIGIHAVNNGTSSESIGVFDAYIYIGQNGNQYLLSRNSDGLIVDSGKYQAIAIMSTMEQTVKNMNIEWV